MKAGFVNPNSCKFWPDHKERRWLLWTIEIWGFLQDCPPMLFQRESGVLVKFPDSTGFTDFASTPPLVWSIPGFDPVDFCRPAWGHDQCYKNHWLWVSTDNGLTWSVLIIDRAYADDFLAEMILNDVDPGGEAEAETYKANVRMWGWTCWGKGTTPPSINVVQQTGG